MRDSKRVLCVGKQERLEKVRSVLEKRGFEVVLATEYEETVSIVRNNGFDCVVSCHGEDFDGFELAEDLDEVRLVLFPEEGGEEVVRKAVSKDVDEYVSDEEMLVEKVSSLAENRENTDGDSGFNGVLEGSEFEDVDELVKEFERYRALVETVADGMYMLDEEGRIKMVNDTLCNDVGYSRDELVGEHVSKIMREEDVERGTELIRELLKTDEDWAKYEIVIDDPDGGETVYEDRVAVITGDDGEYLGSVGTIRNIDERKKREHELEMYEEMVNTVPDLVYALDEEGEITAFNDAGTEMLGWTREEIIGDHVSKVMTEEDTEKGRKLVREMLEGKRGSKVSYYLNIVRKDGEKFPAESHMALLTDEDGEFKGSVGVTRDITDRKKREKKFESLYETTRDLMRAETREEICRIAVETSRNALELRLSGIHLQSEDELIPVATTPEVKDVIGDPPPSYGKDSFVWDVFQEGETKFIEEVKEEETPAESAILLPLGKHGIHIISSEKRADIDDSDIFFAEILAANTEAALDRLERENEMKRNKEKIQSLHDVATRIETCEIRSEIYSMIVKAAEEILDFDHCVIAEVSDGMFEMREVSSDISLEKGDRFLETGEGVAGEAFEKGETILVSDVISDERSRPVRESFKSSITVPMREIGVFQAISSKKGGFDEDDVELAELLVSHATEAIKSVEKEEKIREERDRLAALFRNVPSPVIHSEIREGEPIILTVNPAFEDVFGYSAGEVEGENLNEVLVPPEKKEESRKLDRKIIQEGELRTEVERETKDGMRHFLLQVVTNEIDGTTEAYSIYADITERMEKERKLREKNEQLDRFASIVSHDLRNPLQVAEGRLDMVSEEIKRIVEESDQEEGRTMEHITKVENAHDRMRSLIEDILALARQGGEIDEEDIEMLELGRVATAAWESVDTKRGDLNLDHAEEVSFEGDYPRVCELLENLFRNAIEHGSEDVRVDVGKTGRGFYVEDDGPGIPEDEREDIFEHGYTTRREGTGFGLSIVENIAEAHGWEVSVGESELGGARFEINIEQ